MLKDMLRIVKLPVNLIHNYTNKFGRATLVTRMATSGVPDGTGRLVTGHHTTAGYANYDRTATLKQQAAVLASATPGLTFEAALKEVSSNIVQEKVIDTFDKLEPLIDVETTRRMDHLKRTREQERGEVEKNIVLCEKREAPMESGKSSDKQFGGHERGVTKAWHKGYDNIDWEKEFRRNPMLAKLLGGTKSEVSNVANHMTGVYSNCNITIHVVQPSNLVQASSAELKTNVVQSNIDVKGKGKENQG